MSDLNFSNEFNPNSLVLEQTFYNCESDLVTEVHYRDLSDLMAHNKFVRDTGLNGYLHGDRDKSMRAIATIDKVTALKLWTEHGIDLNTRDGLKAFKSWLKQPENAGFRTYTGSI